jgi:DNA uptake protein ComE-like DNA-binding protein
MIPRFASSLLVPSRRLGFALLALALTAATSPIAARAQVGAGDLVDPNLASADELAALPGLDDATAAAIVEARPHLSMLAFHHFLHEPLGEGDRSELYARLFLPIDLNDTSREEILLVPGVGERMAHEFEEYRPYAHLDEFRREIGKYVDDDEVARLAQFVFVPIDLNTASDEDILSIPGLGDRMLREFKEYRPYTSIEQFRREIGKYVDEGEVARLERYVTIGQGG